MTNFDDEKIEELRQRVKQVFQRAVAVFDQTQGIADEAEWRNQVAMACDPSIASIREGGELFDFIVERYLEKEIRFSAQNDQGSNAFPDLDNLIGGQKVIFSMMSEEHDFPANKEMAEGMLYEFEDLRARRVLGLH